VKVRVQGKRRRKSLNDGHRANEVQPEAQIPTAGTGVVEVSYEELAEEAGLPQGVVRKYY